MTTTTDFLFRGAPVGTGAGGNSPRRLIPSCFSGTAAAGEPTHWTASLIRIVVVLAVSAAASLAASLVLDRSGNGAVVIAPVHLPADPPGAEGPADLIHRPDIQTGHRGPAHHPSEPGDLFE